MSDLFHERTLQTGGRVNSLTYERRRLAGERTLRCANSFDWWSIDPRRLIGIIQLAVVPIEIFRSIRAVIDIMYQLRTYLDRLPEVLLQVVESSRIHLVGYETLIAGC
jgi:hypothetical protein